MEEARTEESLGRGHHHYGFSMWMAGGGVKRGITYGATDELGMHAIKDRVSHHDLHATIVHLLGLDEEEARIILREAVDLEATPKKGLGAALQELFRPFGGVELNIPPREPMREPPRFD